MGQKWKVERMSERVVGRCLKGVESRSCLSRVRQRRGWRDVSHRGSPVVPRRKRKEREMKESKERLGREGEKCEGCGEGERGGAREDIRCRQQ